MTELGLYVRNVYHETTYHMMQVVSNGRKEEEYVILETIIFNQSRRINLG